ncbi:MAG: hypothetical protein KDD37_00515 [Bdellovibrionales bacterium]|nr:hypothetical protein [Bdellovibrionales bacterium]
MLRIYSLVFLLLTSCALFEKEERVVIDGLEKPPYQRLYNTEFEKVWRAVQISLSNYPIAVNNMDAGVLETDYIKSNQGWLAPEQHAVPPGGRKYKINVQVARGVTPDSSDQVVRVRVTKKVVVQRDFFSDLTDLESDGLEEHVILYRIQREVDIDRGLEKAYQRMKRN